MASVESSPSVRRSNSYRVALRKSGISKEYIEELDKMLSTDVEQTSSVNTESTVNDKPKTKLFKRNYRGVASKQSSAINSSGNSNSNNNISTAQITQNDPISINSSKERDTAETGEVTSVKMDQKDNFSHSDDDDYYTKDTLPKTPNKSSCKHLLCYICCCNYCAFLSSTREMKIS